MKDSLYHKIRKDTIRSRDIHNDIIKGIKNARENSKDGTEHPSHFSIVELLSPLFSNKGFVETKQDPKILKKYDAHYDLKFQTYGNLDFIKASMN